MINTNELMLGNWILHDDKPIKISGITENHIASFANETGVRVVFSIKVDEINPILITKEIIEKCGFESSYGDYINEKGYKVYYFARHWHLDIGFYSIPFSYLHQFQNLYFLITGKQLKINL